MKMLLNADLLILLALGFSTIWSIFQAFLQTVLSVLNWVIATFIATVFLHELSNLLTNYFPILEIRLMIAFVSLLCSTLLLSSWLAYLLMQTFPIQKKSYIEFILGAFLGFLRGTLVVLACVIIVALTPLNQASWWHSSKLIAYFSMMSHQISGFP